MSDGLETIRTQLLTSLHLGKLGPGDRVPSVRSMARITGLNRKTVHRAYLRLAREGLLELRWGSGTFLSDDIAEAGEGGPSPTALMGLFERFREEASALGLDPSCLPRFLSVMASSELSDAPLAVVECNDEQTGLIARELAAGGLRELVRVRLDQLGNEAEGLADGVFGVVTTDCHRDEVEALVRPAGLNVYRVALDKRFPEEIVHWLRRGAVLMVVSDRRFGPVFSRLLGQMGVPDEQRDRLRVVEPEEGVALLSSWREGAVYVSPLVEGRLNGATADGTARIAHARYVDERSADALRVRLALDIVRDGGGDA